MKPTALACAVAIVRLSGEESDEVDPWLAIVSLAAPLGAVLETATTFTLTIVDDD